jgi:cell division protein FtsZ
MFFDLPKNESSIIKVIGVGGGGSNAVGYMFRQGIVGVEFAICNTDNQALQGASVPTKIHLGPSLTEGRGAGSKPDIGKKACLESLDEIRQFLETNTKMLFITAGMGGGTGTGAAPIIAKLAQEMDILTVGIVTLPFSFEGRKRTTQGFEGLDELKKNVDTLIVISNDKLRQIHGNLSLTNAFSQADNILTTAAKGIAEIITVPGYVNVDFEDVNTVMRHSGIAIMGTASADGEGRARRAVDMALSSPLLEENNIKGAQNILLNITSGNKEVTMDEIFEITEFVQDEAGFGTNLIWGNCYDESLGDKLSVTVIATGFERPMDPPPLKKQASAPQPQYQQQQNIKEKERERERERETKIKVSLDDDFRDNNKPAEKKTTIYDIGFIDDSSNNSSTFEFEPKPRTPRNSSSQQDFVNRHNRQEDPFIKKEHKEEAAQRSAEDLRRHLYRESQRREQLRQETVKIKLTNPQNVVNLENEPAYMRRKVSLDDFNHSSQEMMSRWTISEDGHGDIDMRSNNSFLHDNAD